MLTTVLLVVGLGLASAQETPQLTPPAPGVQFVTQLAAPAVTVTSGKPRRAELRFRIAAGDHINSNLPRSPLLIPTRLKLRPPTDLATGRITYPPGRDLTFPFAPEEKLSVYTGEFSIGVQVAAARTASAGPYRVHGELQYRACNDRQCFPPKKLPVVVDVKVVAAPSRSRNPGQSPHIHR